MNTPLIILEHLFSYENEWDWKSGKESFIIAHKREKVTKQNSQEVVEYILKNFNIHLRSEDLERIPIGFPVTVDSLIETNKQYYSRLF